MKKVICLGLCFIFVLTCFVFSFANSSPVIIPLSDNPSNSGYSIVNTQGVVWSFSANNSPVYVVFAEVNNSKTILFFSDSPNTVVYWNSSTSGLFSYQLTNNYNGYYFTYSSALVPDDYIYGSFDSVYDVIDSVDSSVFSTTFDLTYLIDGSVSWLSSMSQAVKTNGLLLFFVLIIFVGVGIGLLKRFNN